MRVLASGETRDAAERLGFEVSGYRRSLDPDVRVAFEAQADPTMARLAGAELAFDARDALDAGEPEALGRRISAVSPRHGQAALVDRVCEAVAGLEVDAVLTLGPWSVMTLIGFLLTSPPRRAPLAPERSRELTSPLPDTAEQLAYVRDRLSQLHIADFRR